MKKYLIDISLFLLITFIVLIGISWVNSYIIHNALKKNNKNTTTLVLGDSHARWINEAIIPNSVNLSQGGDTYKASYYKLRKMVEIAPNLDTVIIAFDYHNLGDLYTKKIKKDKESIKRIAQLATIPEMIASTTNYPKLIEILFQQKISFSFRAISRAKEKYTFDDNKNYHVTSHLAINHDLDLKANKNYKKLKAQDSINYQKKIASTNSFYFEEAQNKMGHLTLDYLDKMIEICNNNGLKLVFISMPLDPDLTEIIPEKFKQKFSELIADYQSDHNIQYIDFRSEFDQEIGLLENPDHSSPYGGALLSEKLLTIISGEIQ